MQKRIISLLLTFCLLLSLLSVTAFASSFKDVQAGAYYEAAVDWAVEEGITNGTGDSAFSPKLACTRAQVVTFLWRSAGEPEPESTDNPFGDVADSGNMSHYYTAILWAVGEGITKGKTTTSFAPGDTVTRAEFVTFLYRYAGEPEVTVSNPFKDIKSSDYFYDSVLWAAANGITTGTSTTAFTPKQDCTRAQVVTFLYRYYGHPVEAPELDDISDLILDENYQEKKNVAMSSLPKYDAALTEDNVMAILDACDPDGALMMRQGIRTGDNILVWWFDGETIIDSLDTAVHEECHGYMHTMASFSWGSWSYAYYLGQGQYRDVAVSDVFPGKEIAAYIPEELRTFRFDTYVGSATDSLGANQYGIFGQLNEFNAYSWGMHNTLALFDYYMAQEQSTDLWHVFINSCENNRQAYAEFRYYMLTYMLYARDNYPEIYAELAANEDLKKTFRSIDARFAGYLEEYEDLLDQILAHLKSLGYTVRVDGDVIYISTAPGSSTLSGVFRYTADYELLMEATETDEYQEMLAVLNG